MKQFDRYAFSRPLGILLLSALTILIIACSAGAASSSSSSSSQAYASDPIVSTPVPEQVALPGAVKVYVTLQEYYITSSVHVFHTGVPYYFIVTNRGHVVHEFLIRRDNPNGTPISFEEDPNAMFIQVGQVFPGTTLRMNFTFTSSLIGKSEIACLMRGHYAAGMHLPIVVSA